MRNNKKIYIPLMNTNTTMCVTHLLLEKLLACTKIVMYLLQILHELGKLLGEVRCWSGGRNGVSDHSTLLVRTGLCCHSAMLSSANI